MRRITIAAAGLVLGAGVVGLAKLPGGGAPTVRWLADDEPTAPLAELRAGARIRCTIDAGQALWIYAVAWNPSSGCLALIPSETLRTETPTSPAPVGRHDLPGLHLDATLSWVVPDAGGPTSFVLVASRGRLPTLEAELRRLRQVGNAAFPHRAELGTYAPKAGIDAVPPRYAPPPGVLGEALRSQQLEHDGTMVRLRDDVWFSVLRSHVALGEPTSESIEQQVRELERELAPALTAPGSPK